MSLCQRRMKFLGYQIDSEGFQLNPKRIDQLSTSLDSHGTAEIPGYVQLLSPVHQKLSSIPTSTHYLKKFEKNNKIPINWTSEAISAFQACKEVLSTVTHTAYPSPNASLILTIDALEQHSSRWKKVNAIGATLQQMEENKRKPIGFFFRKLTKIEF